MRYTRVEVIGFGEFSPREWLRRDVLWASLMSPYGKQMEGWLDGTQKAQHEGNVSRQEIYSKEDSPEAQSMAFFNQGKNVAGLVSSVALFKASFAGSRTGSVNPLEVQANAVDAVLHDDSLSEPMSEAETYATCSGLIERASPDRNFGKPQLFLRASRIMIDFAASEAQSWVETSLSAEDGSLPALMVHDGGHARSAGPRVDMLQPIFKQIVASNAYRALS